MDEMSKALTTLTLQCQSMQTGLGSVELSAIVRDIGAIEENSDAVVKEVRIGID